MGSSPTLPSRKHRLVRRVLVWLVLATAVFACLLAVAGYLSAPYAKKLALQTLTEKFRAQIQIRDFDVSVWPRLSLHGVDLAVRQYGRTDVPPEITVREFSAETSPLSLLKRPWKIDKITLKDLNITIVRKAAGQPGIQWARLKDVPVIIGELSANDAQLDIVPQSADKPHHLFKIHRLLMNHVGLHRPANFIAQLTNPKPPGNIDSRGNFGPWNPDDPGLTPLAASYTFKNADLGVFKGISGTLSSRGKYSGVLNRIEVEGETDTPNFTVAVGGHAVNLHTDFSAIVDGLNGNTILKPVRAHFLGSTIIANGEVAKKPGAKGRSVVLKIDSSQARVQDLLWLAVKSETPAMTGNTNLRADFDLPPGEGDLIERLHLSGIFSVQDGVFSNPTISSKVQALSRRGEGKPGNPNAGDSTCTLNGDFQLGGGVIDFRRLGFSVTGASVQLAGNYGLESEQLNFHGTLRLDAKLSQTVTGIKSLLLKPVDPFFRKHNETELPIKVTGTRSAPSFGLDLHHKTTAQANGQLHASD